MSLSPWLSCGKVNIGTTYSSVPEQIDAISASVSVTKASKTSRRRKSLFGARKQPRMLGPGLERTHLNLLSFIEPNWFHCIICHCFLTLAGKMAAQSV